MVEVIECETVKPGFYFCDSFGFKEVPFDPKATQTSERFCKADEIKSIEVLLIEPEKYPRVVQIENILDGLQAAVGGDIEEYMPFDDDAAIICNEDGKNMGLPLNRAIYAEPPMVEMTYQEMKDLFRETEKIGAQHLTGYIVFSAESFDKPYPVESRTYVLSSDNKAFRPNMGGYSIYASALDGSDMGVRLEQYMADEKGGKDGWKVERCYMKGEPREIADIIAGTFFIARAPIEAEHYQSLTPAQTAKYQEMFKYPERFFRTDEGIVAQKFRPVSKDMER